MKATQGTTYRMLNSRLNDIANTLETLRNIGATNTKLHKPSDDPTAVRPVFNTRKQLSNVDRYLATMGQASDTMKATDSYLAHVENIMQRAKEIMVNSVNSSLSDKDLGGVLADEMAQLRQELLDTANGAMDGKYLFAGYNENIKPFSENPNYDPALYDPNDSSTWPCIYQGDDNSTSLEITTGELIEVNLTGNALFFGTATWDPNNPNAIGSGGYDLFAELTQAEEALRSGNVDNMRQSIGDLEGAAEQERHLRSQLGNRATRVQSAINHQESVKVDLKQILSRYQDADAIESFNDIVQMETAYQAALNVTSRVAQLSILDYL